MLLPHCAYADPDSTACACFSTDWEVQLSIHNVLAGLERLAMILFQVGPDPESIFDCSETTHARKQFPDILTALWFLLATYSISQIAIVWQSFSLRSR